VSFFLLQQCVESSRKLKHAIERKCSIINTRGRHITLTIVVRTKRRFGTYEGQPIVLVKIYCSLFSQQQPPLGSCSSVTMVMIIQFRMVRLRQRDIAV